MTITATARPPASPPPPRPRWGTGRIVALVLGFYLLLASAGALGTTVLLSDVENDRRDGDYLTTDATSLETERHALAVEKIDLNGLDGDWVLGRARLRATASDPDASVFIGVARADDAAEYLRDVGYTTVTDVDDQEPSYEDHSGSAPSSPEAADIWVAQASGTGTQAVTWTPSDGSWTAVVMNADGAADVQVRADVGATVPAFEWVTCSLWVGGGLLAIVGAVLVGIGPRRRTRF